MEEFPSALLVVQVPCGVGVGGQGQPSGGQRGQSVLGSESKNHLLGLNISCTCSPFTEPKVVPLGTDIHSFIHLKTFDWPYFSAVGPLLIQKAWEGTPSGHQ